MQKNAEVTEQKKGLAHLIPSRAALEPQSDSPGPDPTGLAGRLRQGDRAAAEELVELYYERMYQFMRAMGHDSQMSEDLVQEVFMRAWYHIGQLRDGRALTGWLFRIAGNVSRLHWRRHKPEDRVHSDDIEPPADSADTLARAGDQEQFGRLHEAIEQLPWKLRQAIVLHYMDQLTIAEAAEAANVRQGTLKSRLSRALEALRKHVPDE